MSHYSKTRLPHYDETAVPQDAARYANANPVMNELRRNAAKLSPEEYTSIRRQALGGDVSGALERLRMTVWTRG